MKIHIKTEDEIKIIQEGGKILHDALEYVKNITEEGVTTKELDEKVEKFIISHNAIPAFKGYNNFPATLCTSVNDEVVHGIPSNYILKNGDIVGIDCGLKYKGFYTDSAVTLGIGEISPIAKKLIKITEESLLLAIEKIEIGINFKEIARTIQNYVEKNNFSVVRELVGHGIGRNLHEDPQIPNFVPNYPLPNIKEGMVFCIEPMINQGIPDIEFEKNGTVKTKDGLLSAHFELQLAVLKNNIIIIT
jgi:methionyl aminopeptidase